MDWEGFTTDQLEQELLSNRQLRSGIDAEDMEILEVLDRRQVATADGAPNLSEWAAATLDIGLDTARTLVRTMRRTVDRSDLRAGLAAGEVTLDRVEALSRIPEDVGLLEHFDIAGVRRIAAQQVRITAEDEYRTANDRYLVLQPSLDASWWKLFGGLERPEKRSVSQVLYHLPHSIWSDHGPRDVASAPCTITRTLTPFLNPLQLKDDRPGKKVPLSSGFN